MRLFGIRGRLLLLVLAAIAPLIILGVVNIRREIAATRTLELERAFGQARVTAALIDSQLRGVDTLLLGLASTVSLETRELPRNEPLLVAVHANLPSFYLSLEAFALDGAPLGATDGRRQPSDWERSFLRVGQGQGGMAAETAPVALPSGHHALKLARVLSGPDGRPAGMVAATVDLEQLGALFNSPPPPAGMVVTVVNERRLVLMRSRDAEQWIGRDAVAFGGAADADEPGMAASAACAVTPWRVYAGAPVTGGYVELGKEYGSTLLIGFGAVAAALVLAWLIAGRITKPILQLADDARHFSAGETKHRSRVSSKSEVGSLARTFNRMLDALQRRDAELRASESRYRTLIDSAPEAILVFDVEKDRFVDHNLAAERLFKLDGDALRRVSPFAISPACQPDGRASVEMARTYLDAAIGGGAPVFEWVHQDSAGQEIPCEVRLLRLPAEDRVLVRGSITAISERKQAERRLAQTLALQHAILDHAGYAIISTTPEGVITTFNPAAERLLGYAAAEVVGQHAARLIHDPEEIAVRTQALSAELGRMIAPGFEVFMARAQSSAPGEQEWTYIRKDGSLVPVQLAVTALSDAAGQTTGFIGMAVDITERRRAEQQLAHERTVLELIARGTPLNVVLTMLLKGHEKLFPATLGSVMLLDPSGKRFVESIAPSLPAGFGRQFEGVAIGPAVGSCGTAAFSGKTVIATDIASDPRWDDYRQHALPHGLRACWSTPIRSGQGGVLGAFALYYREPREPQPHELAAIASSAQLAGLAIERRQADIARGDLERKLLETQKLESLGVLAGGIAHDVNNLLTGILGNASLASAELPAGSPMHDYLGQINESSLRAADLCKQMLAYSGKGRFLVQQFNLSRLVEETTHLLQISISKKARLSFELAPDIPSIEADATQLRQVVMNLVMNASEAIGERSGTITISTGLRRVDRAYFDGTITAPELPGGDYVVLKISDDGCGMSAETQAKIFDPFFSTKFTGRGLGLAAVIGIMRGHHGALAVQSELGRGTTFELLFPLANGTGEKPPAVDLPSRPAWRGHGTVLVVDDEEPIRRMGARMLQSLGFETVAVADGREAVAAFRENPRKFTLVLLDLTMPNMDGEQAFTEMRLLKSDVRVILMSGFNRQESVARFTGRGLASFLQKPFGLETLRETLRVVLGGET